MKRKAPTSTKTQPKRQKSMPIPPPTRQPKPANAPEQAVDLSAQGTPSAIVSQEQTTDDTTEELPPASTPVNPTVEDIPSSSTADPSHAVL
jgi:hypothetical protein